MHKRILIWTMIVFLLPTMACGLFGGGDDEAPAAAPPPTQAPAQAEAPPTVAPVVEETEEVVTDAPTEEPAQPETAGGEKVTFTGSPNLDQLSSYRVFFSMDFDGTSGGQPSQGYIEMILESTKDPKALHLDMEMEGSTVEQLGGSNNLEFYDVDGTMYIYNDAMGGQWISTPSGDDDTFQQGFFNPGEDLELPQTAVCDSAAEDINGISATHCSFTEDDVESDEATYENLTGDVWVAEDGGYIVKFELTAEGYQSVSQEQGSLFDFGDVSFAYELSDVDGDFTIMPPDEALDAPSFDFGGGGGEEEAAPEFPVLDDAEEVFSVAGITTYYTNSDVATAVDFYRQALPAEGWTEDAEGAFVDETTGLLTFEKEGATLTITLNQEDDGRVNVGLISSE